MRYVIALVAVPLLGFLLTLNWLGYRAVLRFFNVSSELAVNGLRVLFIFLSFSFIFASILAFNYNNVWTRIFYTISASWLGFGFYILLAAGITWVVVLLARLFGFNLDVALLGRWLLLVAVLVGVYGVFNANNLRVREIEISLPNLPAAWQGRTAIWVSDIHLGQVRNLKFAQKISSRISSLNPDIVFIGGDLYDGVAADLNALAEPFGRIKAPLGVYFITGNHEEFGDNAKYLDAIRKAGIKVLLNEKIDVDGVGVAVTGVDYKDTTDEARLSEIFDKLNLSSTQVNILLNHQPTGLKTAEAHNVSFQISGHTHQAQLYPLSLFTQLVFHGYDYGLKSYGKMQVYTSSGVGTWGPPMRVGTASEIVRIKFK
jgi:uncharacterized protein